jgi:hypothetical protein
MGQPLYGGSGVRKDVRAIYSTQRAFAALKKDGTVQAWGDFHWGGDGSVPADLKDVKMIFGSTANYADSTAPSSIPLSSQHLRPWLPELHSMPSGQHSARGSARHPVGYRQLHGVLAARKVLV